MSVTDPLGAVAMPKTTTNDVPVSAGDLGGLGWPTTAADGTTGSLSLEQLLQALQLLATDTDRKQSTKSSLSWDADTPASIQVIKSGVLGITRNRSKLVTWWGGGAALASLVAAPLNQLVFQVGEALTVCLVASAALLLGAAFVAIAIIVRADLEARGAATAGRHQGRAGVAAAFLVATALPRSGSGTEVVPAGAGSTPLAADLLLVLSAFAGRVRVTTRRYTTSVLVAAVSRSSDDEEVELLLDNGDWVGLGDVTGFTTAP